MLDSFSFIGREPELHDLRAVIDSPRSAIVVVYGRRRIGKSELVRKALEGRRSITIEGLENGRQSDQIAAFLLQLSQQLKTVPVFDAHSRPSSWKELFLLLYNLIKDDPCHICLDEFQWMAHYQSRIVAELKLVWDQYLSRLPGVTLVLCGSIASFMVTKVIRSSALYGRTDLQIHLQPFTIKETAQLCVGRGFLETLESHLFTGGIPKYINILRDETSVRLALQKHAFTATGYFVSEFDRIFVSHFGKNPVFRNIIRFLAQYPYGLWRKDIARLTGAHESGLLSAHLDDLEAAGFISSQIPFNKKSNSRLKKYFLTDAYMRFYYAFIAPDISRISAGVNKDIFLKLSQTGAFYAWMGRAFEYFCIQHAALIARIMGFSGIDFSCGPFFRPPSNTTPGFQIDLLFNRADNVVTLCEMKYSHTEPGIGIIAEVEKKAEMLMQYTGNKTIQKVLITLTPPGKELAASGYFYRTIQPQDFLNL
jgi:AAA+ ATPase superfamily predicted ATPase